MRFVVKNTWPAPCEGPPFLVDACPRIVTPAYVKPRSHMRRGATSFQNLALSRRHVFTRRRNFLFPLRSCRRLVAGPWSSTLKKKDRECEGTLRTQLKRYARTRPSSRTTFFLPPPSLFVPLFFSLYIFYIYTHTPRSQVERVLDDDDESIVETSFTNLSFLSSFLNLFRVSYFFVSSQLVVLRFHPPPKTRGGSVSEVGIEARRS